MEARLKEVEQLILTAYRPSRGHRTCCGWNRFRGLSSITMVPTDITRSQRGQLVQELTRVHALPNAPRRRRCPSRAMMDEDGATIFANDNGSVSAGGICPCLRCLSRTCVLLGMRPAA